MLTCSPVLPRTDYNPYSGELSLDFPRASHKCCGGLLADEMGLGTLFDASVKTHS